MVTYYIIDLYSGLYSFSSVSILDAWLYQAVNPPTLNPKDFHPVCHLVPPQSRILHNTAGPNWNSVQSGVKNNSLILLNTNLKNTCQYSLYTGGRSIQAKPHRPLLDRHKIVLKAKLLKTYQKILQSLCYLICVNKIVFASCVLHCWVVNPP